MAEDKKDNKLQDNVIKKDDEKKSAEVEDTEAVKVDKNGKSVEEVKSADDVKSEDETDDKAELNNDVKSEDETDDKAELNNDVKSEDETDNKAELNDDVKSEDETDNKAESKDDAKSEDEIDNKVESNDDAKSEDKTDDKVELNDDAKAENETDNKAESNDDAKSEDKTDDKVELNDDAKAENETDNKAESKDDAKAENEADGKAESKDDAKAENEADGKAESKDDAKAENETDAKAESKDDAKAEDETDAKAESKDDAKSENETDDKAESNDDAKSENETDDKAESNDDAKSEDEVADKAASNDDKSAKSVVESLASQFDKTRFKNRMLATTVLGVFVGLSVGFGLGHFVHPGGVAINTAYGNITSSQIYNRVKQNQDTQMTAQSLIMEKALEHDFPKAATDQKVNARFKKIKANKFTYYQELQQLGNDTAIKDNIKDSLLLEAAVAKNSKVTKAQVKEAYKTYRPGMTMAFVQVDSASKAKDVHDQLAQAKNYKDFADEVTTLHNQDSKHVSAGHLLPQISSLSDSQDVPAKIKNAAMKLNKGDVSPVIKINNKTYVILYMKSITEKSSYANDKGEIKQTLKRQEQTNSTNRQRVMLKYAKKAHPKAVDSSYKDLVKQMNQVAKAND